MFETCACAQLKTGTVVDAKDDSIAINPLPKCKLLELRLAFIGTLYIVFTANLSHSAYCKPNAQEN